METGINEALSPIFQDNTASEESVLAVIIAYKPDLELMQRNIKAFINYVDKLIIWDNTPNTIMEERCKDFDQDKVIYEGVGKNVGISKALNFAWRYASKWGYEYLLTMDQDSVWCDFSSYKESVMKKNKEELCVCGPCAYNDINNRPTKRGFESFRWQITSGMLVKIELLNIIGGYNDSFFVDCVDIELCLRARSKGFNSYYCYDGFLLQKYGIPSKTVFLGKERNYIYYSPFRVRGIIGGHIFLYRKYKHPDLPRELRRFAKEAIKSIVYSGKQPVRLTFALINGFIDGFFKKYRYM